MMKRFLFVLTLLVVFCATIFNSPKPDEVHFSNNRLQYQNFYEIEDGPGIVPLTRDKQVVFKVAYPEKAQSTIKRSEVLTNWEPMTSIFLFWLLIIGVNAFLGVFYKGKKKLLIITQTVVYGIVLAAVIYLQTLGFFSHKYFILLNVFILLGILLGGIYHDAFDKEFRLTHIVFGVDVPIFLWNAIYVIMPSSHVFALPPKAFYVTVVTVIIGYLLLPTLFFIRKAVAKKKQTAEESEKTE